MRQHAWPFWKRAPGARTNTSPSGTTSHTWTFVAVPRPRARTVIVNWIVLPPRTTCLFATFSITSTGFGSGGAGFGLGGGGGAGFAVFTILQTRVAPAVAGALTVIGAE